MTYPSFTQLTADRRRGYRPEAVGCFVCQQKVLFVYSRKHRIWQFPQGGVEKEEQIEEALFREMEEELGVQFVGNISRNTEFIGSEAISFAGKAKRELEEKTGNEEIRGKRYYIFAIKTEDDNLDTSDTEFDDHRWLNYQEAVELTEKIYQRNKRRVTLKALIYLKQKKYL